MVLFYRCQLHWKQNHSIKFYIDTIPYGGLWAQARFLFKKEIISDIKGV